MTFFIHILFSLRETAALVWFTALAAKLVPGGFPACFWTETGLKSSTDGQKNATNQQQSVFLEIKNDKGALIMKAEAKYN